MFQAFASVHPSISILSSERLFSFTCHPQIDCAANQALCKQYGVNFIPNIKHFYQGKVQDEMSAEKTLGEMNRLAILGFWEERGGDGGFRMMALIFGS